MNRTEITEAEGVPANLNNLPETGEVKTGFSPLDEFSPLAELERSWIDPELEIPEPPVILNIDGVPVMTSGNISTIIGKAKSKKTFLNTGMVSAISHGVWGPMEGMVTDKVTLWFDTEQSLYHSSTTVKRCFRMGAGQVQAYTLRGYSPAQRLKIIEAGIYDTKNLGFVVIDGVRDLLTKGINDEEEATAISSAFLRWTSELQIHVAVVLHMNKGDNHARGHVGTELMNKSETVISVAKHENDETISVVTPEYSRNIDFKPFAFTIDMDGLPVIADMPEETPSRPSTNPFAMDKQRHFDVLALIFDEQQSYRYSELWPLIQVQWGKKGITFGIGKAKQYLTYYKTQKWITQTDGYYKYNRAVF